MKNPLIASGLLLLIAACGGGSDDGNPAPTPIANVAVAPVDPVLNRGETMQLWATLTDARGKVLSGRNVTWSSDDTSVATVTQAGMLEAKTAGRVKITATAESKSGSVQVSIIAIGDTVHRVELNKGSTVIAEGDSETLIARAFDAEDREIIGRGVRWTTLDAGIASVAADGMVTALKVGATAVSATVDGKSATAGLRVVGNYNYELIYGKADVGVGGELFTLDISDPAAVPTAVFPPGFQSSHATGSPDGTRIAFVQYGSWDSAVFVADRDGGNVTRITFLPGRNDQPAWSPDGARIAFRNWPIHGDADIYVVNADGSGLNNLTDDLGNTNQNSPAWSWRPVGGTHRIAFSHVENGNGHLWTMSDDGVEKSQITSSTTAFDDQPSWSPDDTMLIFERSAPAVFGDLYLVPSGGGSARALMPQNPLAGPQFSPSYSPDGRLIAFTSRHVGDRYQVWTVWADGTRLAQRTNDEMDHVRPAWIGKL